MTKAQAQAPRRSVYLHCSSIFTEANAHVRKTKNGRKLLKKNKHSFRALTSEYNLETICNVAKELLDAGIFESTSNTPTLYPLSLPYKTQHRLLTIIQSILEECCFNFGRLWLPEVLKTRSCECVESIELTRWTRILVRYCKHLPLLVAAEIPDVSFRDVHFKTHQIRHTAVHRRVVSVGEVEKMIGAASLTTVLKDALRTRKFRLI
jgi:hypothetical protein